jgi:hypothetical protein
MEREIAVGTILQLLEELGSANLQTVAAELGTNVGGDDVCRALRTALVDELIEPHERGSSSHGLRYRLTPRGFRALCQPSVELADVALP